MTRNLAVVTLAFVMLAGLTSASAQTKAAIPPAATKAIKPSPAAQQRLPSKAAVEASLQRTLGYDPAISWEILDIRASTIPEITDVLIKLNKQSAQHLYLDRDLTVAIIGEMIPFGLNPYVTVRAKLKAADGPVRGAVAPVILMVEFSDFQCEHCKAAQPIVEKLLADFPEVQLVFQQFPLPASIHPWAMKAAEYTDCAARTNPESFWKYSDSIFESQGGIALATADDKLQELAKSAALDAQKLAVCASAPETEAIVKRSLHLGQSLDVTETPTVFINGRSVMSISTIPYDQLRTLVQFEIAHAGR
jgi:protein-disulfide isomerase